VSLRRHVRKLNQLSIRTRVYQNTRRNIYRYVFIYLRYIRSAYVFSFFKQQSSSLRKKRGQVCRCPKTWRLAASPVQNKRNIAPLTANSNPEHVTKVSSFTIFILWINTLVKTGLSHSKLVTSVLTADPKKLEMSIEDRREKGDWLFLRDTLFYHYITMWCSNRYANTCHRSAFSPRRQIPPYLQEQIS